MGDLLVITNQDARFYPLLGPFLSRREVVAELGAPAWDEDDKTWYVLAHDGAVAGFAATQPESHGVHFSSAYVVPVARAAGMYKRLLCARLHDYADQRITVTANARTAPAYIDAGFTVVRQTKQFCFLCREGCPC